MVCCAGAQGLKLKEEAGAGPSNADLTEHSATGKSLLDQTVMDMKRHEIQAFEAVSPFMNANPRKIKRITNMYRLVRTIIMQRTNTHAKAKSEEAETAEKLLLHCVLVWIVLCEQWPVHMVWILQILEDMDQMQRLREEREQAAAVVSRQAAATEIAPNATPTNANEYSVALSLSLEGFYLRYVKEFVFDVSKANCPEPLRKRYQHIYALESDKELFDCLLAKSASGDFQINVRDIGNLRSRNQTKLISYCINLNPAIQTVLSLIKSIPRSESYAEEQRALTEVTEVAQWLNTISCGKYTAAFAKHGYEKREHLVEIENGSIGTLLEACGVVAMRHKSILRKAIEELQREATSSAQREATSAKREATSAPKKATGGDHQKEASTEAKSPTSGDGEDSRLERADHTRSSASDQTDVPAHKDDKSGKDHIGAAQYALSLAMLVFCGIQTPCVIGIYAQWGTGKSFIMNKTIAALKALQIEQALTYWKGRPTLNVGRDLRKLLQDDEEQIELMFKYLQEGAPSLPDRAFKRNSSNQIEKIDKNYKPLRWDNFRLSNQPIWLLWLLCWRWCCFLYQPVVRAWSVFCGLFAAALNEGDTPTEAKAFTLLEQLMEAGKEMRKKKQEHESQAVYTAIHNLIVWVVTAYLCLIHWLRGQKQTGRQTDPAQQKAKDRQTDPPQQKAEEARKKRIV